MVFDHALIYNLIYALAARDGREAALFGTHCCQRAYNACMSSIPGSSFPELWFEVPMAGDPWLDLHALTSRASLQPDMVFDAATTGGHPEVFSWFAGARNVRQLALSWDTGSGNDAEPAVQLLMDTDDTSVTCDFLEVAGRPDAAVSYRAFYQRMPRCWYACYMGVFPERPGMNLRVEVIPRKEQQEAYAHDPALLERHLRQVGLTELGDTAVERCQMLAGMPFQFEFQFDVSPDGLAQETFGASVRFAIPPGTDEQASFEVDGAAGRLMQQIERWGLADGRWRLLADAMFAKRVSLKGKSALVYCYPAFIKLRWRSGEPLDAKAYLMAGVEE